MKTAFPLCAVCAWLACTACGSSSDDPAPGGAPTGTLSFAFNAANGVKQSPNLVDELTGDVYGALYHTADVGLTGPADGAEIVASVELLDVDLTGDQSAKTWTSDPLPVEAYTFLGFFDVDANGADTREPDAGDPVTLPVTNEFEVTADQDTSGVVVFDLVYN